MACLPRSGIVDRWVHHALEDGFWMANYLNRQANEVEVTNIACAQYMSHVIFHIVHSK